MRRIWTFILLLFPLFVFANKYMFKHIEVKDGLSNNQINSIYKDKAGYMWFSTASGLNRYDGRSVKVIRSTNFQNGPLPDNYIDNVQEDYRGYLWVKTLRGYSVYNPVNETFNRDVKGWLSNIGIDGLPQQVYITSNKNMWFYIPKQGIYLFHPETKLVYSIGVNSEDLPKSELMKMIECGSQLIMVYGDGTLVALNGEDAKFKWKDNTITKAVGSKKNQDYSLFLDNDKDLWIYGPQGLWVFNPQSKQWKNRIKALAIGKSENNMVRSVAKDNYNNIWIGNDQGGITIVNKGNSEVIHLTNVQNDERSLQNNNITALYSDNKGTMWVGTYKKGISYYNESAFKFGIDHVGDVNCIQEDNNGTIWLGTNDAGLINWNRKDGKVVSYLHSKANSISSNTVVCMLKARDNSLWIGTFWGGLNHLVNGKFAVYKNESGKANSLANNNVWALTEGQDGKIWIGTLGNGVQSFDPKTNEFVTYDTKTSSLSSDYISSLFMDGDNLIIGSSVGLSVLNTKDGKVINLNGTKSGKIAFSNLDISKVMKDSRGLVWIGTREGLNIYNPKTDDLKILSISDGLTSPIISDVIEDDEKRIWVTTSRGVTCIALQMDGKSKTYTYLCSKYDYNDGLQNCEFNQRSLQKLKSGEIMMGGLYGVNSFNPNGLKYNKISPNVIFTGLALFNQDVNIGEKYGSRVLLDEALNISRKVTLAYKQNVITINVASDDYVAPEKIKFMYKLVGFNDDWLTSNTGKITFTNLSAGDYVLKVKAANNDGFVGREAELHIEVLPPLWLSKWTFVVYALLLICIILIIRHSLIRVEKNRIEVHKAQTEAEKAKELNDMKTKFFINISHELRTPLTMVISPLEVLIKEHEDDTALGTKLKVVYNNAVKLLEQVNQLLDFRKSEANSHQLSLSDGNIISYIKKLTYDFVPYAEKKNIKILFFSSVSVLNVSFDKDKVEKIVNNLVSNAIKFTPEGGKVDVNLNVDYDDAFVEKLIIKVMDTGIGIKDTDKYRIFERFYQVENPEIENVGSGIGLSIVKDFVDILKGSIKVFDNVPNGSVFMVEMPVKRSAAIAKSEVEQSPAVSKVMDSEAEIKAAEDEELGDTSFIHTIEEIKSLLAAKNGEAQENRDDEEEVDINAASTIKLQKATVIQLTEDGENHYMTNIIPSEDIPDYDPSKSRKKDSDEIISEITKDMLLGKDGKPKKKVENKPTVLVADDDVDFLQFMHDTLSVEYNVALVNNGSKAWEYIKDNKPEIILSDVKMPEMDGHQLCALVKGNRLTSHIPFILLTSADSQDIEAEGLSEGADEFVSKPFNIEILMLRMKKLIENKYSKFHSYIEPSPSNITITSMDEKLINKAIKYIEDNISRSDLSVEELSKELGMSRVHLYKKLLAISGKTPIEFIRVIRLKRAAQLLRESQQNVSEIAFQVGFNNPKYFTKYFKMEFGELPSVYQENKGN